MNPTRLNSTLVRIGLLVALILLHVPTRGGEPKADPQSLRQLEAGPVLGLSDKQNTHGWLGIPYAQAPVGSLRWRAPRALSPWTAPRDATRMGPVCTQLGNFISGTGERDNRQVTGQEDCLFLNVWAPRFAPEAVPTGAARLPVMVWIHGGGNSMGTANTYAIGRNLAGRHQVVFVALNYRLGVLGWFYHPALHSEGTSLEDRSGNFGTLDIIQALQWVQANIGAFGGDPGNVTVFGESAGAINAYSLLVSPRARGLFHRAILQSGFPSSSSIARASHARDDVDPGAAGSSQDLLQRLLVHDKRASNPADAQALLAAMTPETIATYLRRLPAASLLEPFKGAALGMYRSPNLIRDGVVLPKELPISLLEDPQKYNAVPVLLGTNRDELKLFLAFNPKLVRKRLGLFPTPRDPATYDREAAYLSDTWKAVGVDLPASLMARADGPPVYAYRFDWDDEKAGRLVNFKQLFGAAHALEVPFVFHDLDDEMKFLGLMTRANRPSREVLSDAMASYWTQFAYTGNPGRGRNGTLPEWRAWPVDPSSNSRLMILDSQSDGGIRMADFGLARQDIEARLLNDPALLHDQEARCRLYAWTVGGLGRQVGWWQEEAYQRFGPTGCRDYPAERFGAAF